MQKLDYKEVSGLSGKEIDAKVTEMRRAIFDMNPCQKRQVESKSLMS